MLHQLEDGTCTYVFQPEGAEPYKGTVGGFISQTLSNVWGKNFSSSTDTQTFENTTYTCGAAAHCPQCCSAEVQQRLCKTCADPTDVSAAPEATAHANPISAGDTQSVHLVSRGQVCLCSLSGAGDPVTRLPDKLQLAPLQLKTCSVNRGSGMRTGGVATRFRRGTSRGWCEHQLLHARDAHLPHSHLFIYSGAHGGHLHVVLRLHGAYRM